MNTLEGFVSRKELEGRPSEMSLEEVLSRLSELSVVAQTEIHQHLNFDQFCDHAYTHLVYAKAATGEAQRVKEMILAIFTGIMALSRYGVPEGEWGELATKSLNEARIAGNAREVSRRIIEVAHHMCAELCRERAQFTEKHL